MLLLMIARSTLFGAPGGPGGGAEHPRGARRGRARGGMAANGSLKQL